MSEPIRKPAPAPESHSPKAVPEIMKLAQQAQGEQAHIAMPPVIKTAPATIPARARNQVRIIELPACKMVCSGVCPSEDCEQMQRFCEWWPAQDELRRDRFYGRDFLCWDGEAKGFVWCLALTEIPKAADGGWDTEGWEVIDFPGGIFAVANYNGGAAEPAYQSIKKWVEKSGCFRLDEGNGRNVMWSCLNSKAASAAMGYWQYDFHVPIKVKEADES